MNLPDVTEYVPHIDPYIKWVMAWIDATWRENALTVSAISLLTGWQIKSPAAIWEWIKKKRRVGP